MFAVSDQFPVDILSRGKRLVTCRAHLNWGKISWHIGVFRIPQNAVRT